LWQAFGLLAFRHPELVEGSVQCANGQIVMKYLTAEEHRRVVERLLALLSNVKGVEKHAAGIEYTSLLMCFAMHSKGACESILALNRTFSSDWFPSSTGYLIVRSLFEIDVTAHYITQAPVERSRQYIDFEHVINKKTLEAVERHRMSKNSTWREGMQLLYQHEYASRKALIESNYAKIRSKFENKNGKRAISWSGKTIAAMAKEVDHVESYEVFYADLSSFAHVNVMLANRFLRLEGWKGKGPLWSQRADEFDVAQVFQYAATFLTCFLELFGKEFKLWDKSRVMACWEEEE
jgi:hypothetical protein